MLPVGTCLPLPKRAAEPFLKLWEQEVFVLLLGEEKITGEVVANIPVMERAAGERPHSGGIHLRRGRAGAGG